MRYWNRLIRINFLKYVFYFQFHVSMFNKYKNIKSQERLCNVSRVKTLKMKRIYFKEKERFVSYCVSRVMANFIYYILNTI